MLRSTISEDAEELRREKIHYKNNDHKYLEYFWNSDMYYERFFYSNYFYYHKYLIVELYINHLFLRCCTFRNNDTF